MARTSKQIQADIDAAMKAAASIRVQGAFVPNGGQLVSLELNHFDTQINALKKELATAQAAEAAAAKTAAEQKAIAAAKAAAAKKAAANGTPPPPAIAAPPAVPNVVAVTAPAKPAALVAAAAATPSVGPKPASEVVGSVVNRPQLVRYANDVVKKIAAGNLRPPGFVDVIYLDDPQPTTSDDINLTYLDQNGKHTTSLKKGDKRPWGFVISRDVIQPPAPAASPLAAFTGGSSGSGASSSLLSGALGMLAGGGNAPTPSAGLVSGGSPAASGGAGSSAGGGGGSSWMSSPYVIAGGVGGAVLLSVGAWALFSSPAPKKGG